MTHTFESCTPHQGSDALRFNVTPKKSKNRDNRQKTAKAIPIDSRERPALYGDLAQMAERWQIRGGYRRMGFA